MCESDNICRATHQTADQGIRGLVPHDYIPRAVGSRPSRQSEFGAIRTHHAGQLVISKRKRRSRAVVATTRSVWLCEIETGDSEKWHLERHIDDSSVGEEPIDVIMPLPPLPPSIRNRVPAQETHSVMPLRHHKTTRHTLA